MDTQRAGYLLNSMAVQIGYRHLDTATVYGSEAMIGEVLEDMVNSGQLKREELFITTKLAPMDTHPPDVIPALRKSLRCCSWPLKYLDFRCLPFHHKEYESGTSIGAKKTLHSELRLEYVDLYLIHFPVRTKKRTGNIKKPPLGPLMEDRFLPLDLVGVWKMMEQCVELGLTKSIGVSNFSTRLLGVIAADAKIIPAVDQMEMHPGCLQKRLLDTCKKMGTVVMAFSPLGSPNYSVGFTSNAVLESPIMKEVAEKHGKSVAQVALRWSLDNGAGVVVKSSNSGRMAQNLDVFGWTLVEEDHKKIATVPRFRHHNGAMWVNQTTSPYKSSKDYNDDVSD